MTNQAMKLVSMSIETIEMAKQITPLIDRLPFDGNNRNRFLIYRLLESIDGIVYSDKISLNELAQNNFEFLDTLRSVITLFFSYPNIFDMTHLKQLQIRIDYFIGMLNSPLFLQHQKLTPEAPDESLQGKRTDEDLPEPYRQAKEISSITNQSFAG